jgi:hypothetical protein
MPLRWASVQRVRLPEGWRGAAPQGAACGLVRGAVRSVPSAGAYNCRQPCAVHAHGLRFTQRRSAVRGRRRAAALPTRRRCCNALRCSAAPRAFVHQVTPQHGCIRRCGSSTRLGGGAPQRACTAPPLETLSLLQAVSRAHRTAGGRAVRLHLHSFTWASQLARRRANGICFRPRRAHPRENFNSSLSPRLLLMLHAGRQPWLRTWRSGLPSARTFAFALPQTTLQSGRQAEAAW